MWHCIRLAGRGILAESIHPSRHNEKYCMKSNLLFGLTVVAAGSLFAADLNPKDDVTNAAKALGEKPNYSWRTTVVVPDDAPFKPGPTDGKAEKDGFTFVTMSFGDNTLEA